MSPLVACIGLLDDLWHAYLVGTDTESEPIKDLGTESPESLHVVASPISFPDSTPPVGHVEESEGSDTSGAGSTSSDSTTPLSPDHPLTHDTPVLVPSLRRTARMAVCVQPMMSPGCSARIAEVAAMSDVALCKRFRSPYESSPSPSPTLPVRKRYKGTSKLVLSTDSEADKLGNKEDSLDSDSGSEGAEDEGPAMGDEDPNIRDEGFSLGEDEAIPEGQHREAPVVETTVGEPLGLGQGSGSAPEPERLERVSAFKQATLTTWTDPKDGTIYIDVPTYPPPAPPVQTPPSPDWMPDSLPISPSHSDVPSPDHTQRLDALPPTLFAEIDKDVRELYTRSGAVRDEIFSQRLVHDLLVQQAALQRELQKIRGRVTVLEQ
ncbi:hypothetical protein Tco_0345463 [Tanacetum coccineum]